METKQIVPDDTVITAAENILNATTIGHGRHIVTALMNMGKLPRSGQQLIQEPMSSLKGRLGKKVEPGPRDISW